jgi:cob(I)alamin adenosyltransferase
MKIYTKTGDAGETGLVGGARVGKDDPRVAAYGDVDEANAALGVVLAHVTDEETNDLLRQIQRDLFALGAQLADPADKVALQKEKARVTLEHVAVLEGAIDTHDSRLPPLKAFILPGGSPLGAFLHLARTVCRRAERSVVALSRDNHVDPLLIVYLNRLSDLLFVLARAENHRRGQPEARW